MSPWGQFRKLGTHEVTAAHLAGRKGANPGFKCWCSADSTGRVTFGYKVRTEKQAPLRKLSSGPSDAANFCGLTGINTSLLSFHTPHVQGAFI